MNDNTPAWLLVFAVLFGMAAGIGAGTFRFKTDTFECAATCGTERGNIMVHDVCYCEYVNLKEQS